LFNSKLNGRNLGLILL